MFKVAIPLHVYESYATGNQGFNASTKLHGCLVRLYCLWWQEINVAYQSPRAHKIQQIGHERLTPGIPERIDENRVVFDGDRTDGGAKLKDSLFELDTVVIVYARAFGKNDQAIGGGVGNVIFHLACCQCAVVLGPAVKPNAALNFNILVK